MATSTVNPTENNTSALDYVTEITTQGRIDYKVVDKETGTETVKSVIVDEDEYQKAESEGVYTDDKDNKFEIVGGGLQTFQKYKFNSIQGALQLMPEEEVVNMINSGTSVKQGNSVRGLLNGKDKKSGQFDFEFSENVYDLRNILASVTNKRLTPTEKLTRDLTEGLEALPPEMLEKFQALIAARQASLQG